MITLVNNPKTLEEALVMTPGTGSQYAYPAGHMFLRYLAKQSLDLTPMVGNSTQPQTFRYSTGDGVVTGYKSGDVINRNMTEGAALRLASQSGVNDLLLTEHTANFADEKVLVVRDVRDKIVTLNTMYGPEYAYMSSSAGELDGRNFNGGTGYEIIFGGNYLDNKIYAGAGGSQLWGGYRGTDELFGGAGVDNFTYYFGDGNDTIQNGESQDIVTVGNLTLDQISSAQINDNGVNLQFTDGGSLTINRQIGTFCVEKNDRYWFYQADYQNKTWTEK